MPRDLAFPPEDFLEVCDEHYYRPYIPRVRPARGRVACIGMFFGVLLLSGCGGSGDRQSIEGIVTLDGKPLEASQITFVPQAGTKGPAAGTGIVAGRFTVPASGSTFAGQFRVEVTATRPTGKKVIDTMMWQPVNDYEQFIPLKYNGQSKLTAEVEAGGKNHFNLFLLLKVVFV